MERGIGILDRLERNSSKYNGYSIENLFCIKKTTGCTHSLCLWQAEHPAVHRIQLTGQMPIPTTQKNWQIISTCQFSYFIPPLRITRKRRRFSFILQLMFPVCWSFAGHRSNPLPLPAEAHHLPKVAAALLQTEAATALRCAYLCHRGRGSALCMSAP